jgi:hypothetical protein
MTFRWIVCAVIISLNLFLIKSETSSTNMPSCDCIQRRKIGLFADKSQLQYSLIDAHSDCMIFSLSLQKVRKFYQLWNSKHRMLLVVEKVFLHPSWRPGIDLGHVGDLQLCSGCDVSCWFVRYSVSNSTTSHKRPDNFGDHVSPAPVNMARVTNDVPVSDQGFHIPNWPEGAALNNELLCWCWISLA